MHKFKATEQEHIAPNALEASDPFIEQAPPLPNEGALNAATQREEKLTPMMQQYLAIKKTAPAKSLLFYRMGDFYELFFQDAVEAAKILGIALTKRGKHLGIDIPMCGVPVHSADDYLQKLILHGQHVCVCEQIEDPKEAKKRGYKSIVKREIVRVVTPATLTEDKLLDQTTGNYLMSLGHYKGALALAWVDISTGVFRFNKTNSERLITDITRINPKEFLVGQDITEHPNFSALIRPFTPLTVLQPSSFFDCSVAYERLENYYGLAGCMQVNEISRQELSAIAGALAYIEQTQKAQRPRLMFPTAESNQDVLFIDAATRNNLELLQSLSGHKEGSLRKAIDRTLTSAGTRLLNERITAPLTAVKKINERLDSVEFFLNNPEFIKDLRDTLKTSPDMPRALARISAGRANPQDLAAIRNGLDVAHEIVQIFATHLLPLEVAELKHTLCNLPIALLHLLQNALGDELPANKRDGGFVRQGYCSELDEARSLRDETQCFVAQLQATYAAQTEIKTLKIKHNNILGYFIEIPISQMDNLKQRAPKEGFFIHRQSLANAGRFTTPELVELETKISGAAEKAFTLELQIFDHLCQQILDSYETIQESAGALAVLDVSLSLAVLATEQNYCRPHIDDSFAFSIQEGRHPVVEQALIKKGQSNFIANNCNLSPIEGQDFGQLWLLTGPNMGGKSTFLRQNALITLMAQMGSFVPARSAHIGVVDRLFSRVGASDDLSHGRSTFMVEMTETATILNQATQHSLVILDEIGRGTATFDGLSIAWASAEYLHNYNQCRGIFATHFHEMMQLANHLPRLQNYAVKVREWQGDIIFLHEIGSANLHESRSYGIQVAKLAGLPACVLSRARELLKKLEEGREKTHHPLDTLHSSGPITQHIPQAPAFSDEEAKELKTAKALCKILNQINPDNLTPRAALEALYHLKCVYQEQNNEQLQ